ncbi:hypothetical protein [Brevibacterium aurantiacum]|uniref:hypothetical protein n=1 Tax=Brevibacterium aurantiacum TaxID=273384 RepID=UPI0014555929|nr:hypothetical protein [Brevibacterium aurantiacum]
MTNDEAAAPHPGAAATAIRHRDPPPRSASAVRRQSAADSQLHEVGHLPSV